MGKPIIATNWSGPTEFMRADNAYPLRIDGLTEIEAGPFKVRFECTHPQRERERRLHHVHFFSCPVLSCPVRQQTLTPQIYPHAHTQGHMYADPSKAHLRALLRHVVSYPDEAAAKGKAARAAMVWRFSPEVRAAF